MTSRTPRQQFVARVERRTDARFLRMAPSRPPPPESSSSETPDDDSEGDAPPVTRGLFATAVPEEAEFEVRRIWAKWRINSTVLYLVQCESYVNLTWEPQANIPWQTLAAFEVAHRDSVWEYQSTRGRRRPLPREHLRERVRAFEVCCCYTSLYYALPVV